MTRPGFTSSNWWTKHVLELVGATMVFVLLSGAVVYGLVRPVNQVEESPAAKNSDTGSAIVPLASLDEPHAAPVASVPPPPPPKAEPVTCPQGTVTDGSSGASGCKARVKPVPVPAPAPPPSSTASTAYSIECGPSHMTLMAFKTSSFDCEVESSGYAGRINVWATSLDSVNGSGPTMDISPSTLVIQPNGKAAVHVAVSAPVAFLGTFRVVMTVQHGDHNEIYNFSALGDTEKSRTLAVEITYNPVPPFNPHLPQEPPLPAPDPTLQVS